jgi:hypothetical protein
VAAYRYLFHDLRTNEPLAELPLRGVSFSRERNGPGDFTGHLVLTDDTRKLDPITATTPARTAYYVERDGHLVAGGILWTRRWKGRRLELAGHGFLSYLDRRRITWSQTFLATDQLDIARQLVERAQQASGGDIGITVPAAASGVLRDRTYSAYELKPLGEALRELAEVENGFEMAIDPSYDSDGTPTRRLLLGYPRLGRSRTDSGYVLEFPAGGIVEEPEWPEDGSAMAVRAHAVGAGEGPAMLMSTATKTQLLAAGWPLLETDTSYKDVTRQPTLDAHARADLAAVAGPITLPVLVCDPDLVLGAGITVGDEVRIVLTGDRWPAGAGGAPGFDSHLRVVGMTVAPGDNSRERVALTCAELLVPL